MVRNKKLGFSLIDIIFAIFFLSLFALVGLKLYLGSLDISSSTKDLTVGSLAASNVVESIYFNDYEYGEHLRYLNSEGLMTDEDDASFVLKYTVTSKMEALDEVKVEVLSLEDDTLVFSLDTKVYTGGLK